MSSTETVTIPLSKLVPWEGNVRKTAHDKSIDELAASISAHGLLQSLVVTQGQRGKYEVVAGQRRLLALKSLAAAGTIKAAEGVACNVAPPGANLTEISLVENVHREPMHPADEFDAFKKLIDQGSPAADVAARFGVAETVVQKRLKLASVSPVLMKVYRDGGMTLQHVMAFTVSDDHAAQEKVWKELPSWQRNNADAIRDLLTDGEITASDKRVKFVTLKAYEKAGGPIKRDLFSDDENGAFILDALLLTSLVTKKLEKAAEDVRKEGWKWVEVAESVNHEELSRYGRRFMEAEPLTPKKQVQLDALNDEYHQIYNGPDVDDEDPRLEALQAKISKLEDREKTWQPATLAIAGAVITIGHGGKTEIMRGYVKPEDAPKKESKKKTVSQQQEDGSVIEVQEASSLSAALMESLTTERTAALTAVLKDRPEVALAALVHTLASQVFHNDGYRYTESAIQISLKQPYLKGIEGTKAFDELERAKTQWGEKLPGTSEGLWSWCQQQDQAVLLDVLAFCVATSVNAIAMKNDRLEGARFRQADDIATAVKLDMSEWFKATADNYFSRVSKVNILEALKETKGEITPAMEKAKKGDLAAIAEREIAPTAWLPKLMRAPTP